MRVVLMVLGPTLLLLVAEAGLRLFGYGCPATFFIPAGSGGGYVTNERFAQLFFTPHTALKPFLFKLPAHKTPGTLRICVLGESAAMGTPDPAFGFGRILEVMLRHRYPDKRLEIVNAAMRGIDSNIIRRIARECAAYEVDAFVVYMGNNEVVGPYGPDPGAPAWRQSLAWIHASQWVRASRLGQLLGNLLQGSSSAPRQDMAYFRQHRLGADDWRRDQCCRNFRANLQEICHTLSHTGAQVLLCTVAVNLQDCPPLGSLHRTDLTTAEEGRWDERYRLGMDLEAKGQHREALAHYLEAAQVDDHFADLHFRLARCYLALGEPSQAQKHYGLARDWDAMQFRADRRMNEQVRSVGAEYARAGVSLVDIENAFQQSELSDQGVPGAKLFYEHVHPTFSGNYLLARSCFTPLAKEWDVVFGKTTPGEVLTEQACAEVLAYTAYQDFEVRAAIAHLTGSPPFLDQIDHAQRQAAVQADLDQRCRAFNAEDYQRCLKVQQAAVSREPDYWPTRFNLGAFYEAFGQYSAAAEQFRYVVNLFPWVKRFRMSLANCLAKAGDKAGAHAQLREALHLDPADAQLQQMLEQLAVISGRP